MLSGLILAGGRSSRMGRDKAHLPFGNRTMLEQVVAVLASIPSCQRIVVVAADEQPLPPSLHLEGNKSVIVTKDRTPDRGPLEGFTTGLAKLEEIQSSQVHRTCFLTSCDVPFLQAAFVEAVVRKLSASTTATDAAVPHDGQSLQPLAAAYDRSVLPTAIKLLSAGRQSLKALLDAIRVRTMSVDSLREVDPRLLSLQNFNTPEQYNAALRLIDDLQNETARSEDVQRI